ncbi:MAG TPA: hypothetical protein VLA12_22330 [Planctomycetaceae bacterium]|nr:hypothetical protein [Planctomycetaceae bacterium]
MDIALFSDSISESSRFAPVRLNASPWREILPLLVSEGEESFVKKMVKALQKELPKLDRKIWTALTIGNLSFLPWKSATEREAELESLWNQLIEDPASAETVAAVRSWQDQISLDDGHSAVELWRLMSSLLLVGGKLPREVFWVVWNAASHAYASLQDLLDIPDGAEGTIDELLVTSCEIRWLSLVVFSEMGSTARLVKEARKAFSDWLVFIDDVDHPVGGADWARLPAVWRSIGRILMLSELSGHDPFRRRNHKSLKRLIETTLAVSAPGGSLWNASDEMPWQVVAQVTERVTDHRSSKLARQVKACLSKASKSSKRGGLTSRPSVQSDAGGWAVLRSQWNPDSDLVLLRHETADVQLTAGASGVPLLAGTWDLKLSFGGETLTPRQPWECVCWFSDKDGDYLELQQVFADEIKIERQVFLSRTDHFLFVNEVAHLPAEGSFELKSSLPICSELKLKRDKQTREYELREGRSRLARMFPLSFEQETIQKASGEIVEEDGRVTLTASGTGGFCLPVVFDWHPKRSKQPAEWRRLTVSENRRACTPAEAAGYRLRIGQRHHLLFYRAIQKSGFPRAILGHHTTNETVIADFDQQGEAIPLLMVE